MTTGIPNTTEAADIERWRTRTEQRTLQQAEQRIRSRVEALYEDFKLAAIGKESRVLVRRALVEAEGLCELAETALRRDPR